MESRIVELTSELVKLPTHETQEHAQAFLAQILGRAGFNCELQDVAPGRPTLVARRDGLGGRFLCSHVDVHPPHGHPDPFTCRRDGDVLIGRGVVDAKGQIAALVTALEEEPDTGALVVITSDEETAALGSERVAVPDGRWFRDGGIVLEPTAFAICTAQAGHVDVRVDADATPGHAYAPEPSGSPIKALLSVIEELDTCNFLKHEHVLVGRPRVNIGYLQVGEHTWRTPAHGTLEMTLGVVPGTDLAEADHEVRDRLEALVRRWDKRGTSLRYEIVDSSAAVEVPSDLTIASWLADAPGTPLHPGGMPSWTDAGNFVTKHGLPCVVFGAGELATAHSDRECVRVGDLVRLAEILRGLLRTS